MIEELRKYKKTGVISEELGQMFLDIANKFTRTKNCFRDYSDLDDYIMDAVLRMCSQASKFDVDRPDANPFWYFTQTVYHRVIAEIKKAKRRNNMRKEMEESLELSIDNNETKNTIHAD